MAKRRLAADDGFEFYEARLNLLGWMPLTVAAILVLPLPALVLVGAIATGDSGGVLIALVLGVIALLPVLLVAPVIWVTQRWSFAVTSQGLTTRSWGRTQHIPWPQVRHVEVDRGMWAPGGVVVVTRDGDRVRAQGTSMREALLRGEPIWSHEHRAFGSGLPYRVAVEVHQRYLAGEFDREHRSVRQRHQEATGR